MQVLLPLIQAANQGGRLFCEFACGMFVQVSIMVLLLMLLDYVFRTRCRVSASLRYALWLLVLVKLVLPPSLAVPTGIGYWLGGDSPPDRVMPSENMPAVWEYAAEVTPGARPSLEPRQVRLHWQGVLCLLWLGIVTWLLVLLIRRHAVMRREIRRAQVAPEAVVNCVQACCATLRLRRPVAVRLSANVPGPVVYGFLHSAILLPASLPERLSPEGLRAVLGHELIHIGRRDTWVHLLQSVLQILYFYHPLVWVANGMIVRVRELAVDETVLAALKIKVTHYTNALIDVAEMAYQKPAWDVCFVGLVESKEFLRRRVTNMFERKSPGRVRLGWVGAMAIVAIGALLIPMGQGEPVRSNSKAMANPPALPEGIAELFELNKESILARFGEPENIFYEDRHYTLADLPEAYFLAYDDLSFCIRKGNVEGITLLDEKYVFGNGIHVGDVDLRIAAAFGPDFTLKEHPVKDFLIYEDLGLSFEIYKPGRIAREINIERRSVCVQKLAQCIARLDIDTAGRQEVIRIFGEPIEYVWRNSTFRADKLPPQYIMAYPASFSVYIADDRIVEIRHGDASSYVCDNGLRIGASLDQVFDAVGKPEEVVAGKNEYVKNVLYKDIDGQRGHCYYHRPDQRLRLWFSDYKLVAIYMTRTDR